MSTFLKILLWHVAHIKARRVAQMIELQSAQAFALHTYHLFRGQNNRLRVWRGSSCGMVRYVYLGYRGIFIILSYPGLL